MGQPNTVLVAQARLELVELVGDVCARNSQLIKHHHLLLLLLRLVHGVRVLLPSGGGGAVTSSSSSSSVDHAVATVVHPSVHPAVTIHVPSSAPVTVHIPSHPVLSPLMAAVHTSAVHAPRGSVRVTVHVPAAGAVHHHGVVTSPVTVRVTIHVPAAGAAAGRARGIGLQHHLRLEASPEISRARRRAPADGANSLQKTRLQTTRDGIRV